MDLGLLRWINRWPESFAPVMRFLSEATNYTWFKVGLILMLIGMIWRGAKSRRAAVQALLAVVGANELTDFFKGSFPEPRPCTVLADILSHGVGCSDSAGTASAHSANMAAVAFVFTWHLGWKWGAPWIVIAFLTGLSRIYHGVHYPHQVLFGWLSGVGVAWIVTFGWDLIRWQRNRVDDRENEPNDATERETSA